MDKALELYGDVLKEHLSQCFAQQQNINPVELNRERFKTKAVFIAAIIFLKSDFNKENRKIIPATNGWLRKSFADDNLLSAIIESASESLIELFDKYLCNLVGIETLDVPTLYENLLRIETGTESNGTRLLTAKNYRNKLGSYYTPVNLAKSVTRKTIDTFFELTFGIKELSAITSVGLKDDILKEIPSISFADFSCGGGNFLVEVMRYFEKLFITFDIEDDERATLLKSIALNISAFDVDCLALEVAKLTLLLRIKQPSFYKQFNETFVHANFLLQSDCAVDESKKIDVFSSGFIYHEQLALRRSQLRNYDVILGNPPWEKIRFEEKQFYALYSRAIANNYFKASRTNGIKEMELNNSQLAEFSKQFKLEIERSKSHLKNNPFFSLSNNGELNTYALFTDAAIKLRTKRGVIGLIVKSAIATSQVNKHLFRHLTKGNMVVAIYDFINRKKIFDIDSRERFCFLLLGNSQSKYFIVSMNLNDVDEIDKVKSGIELSYDDLKLLNPLTGTLPNFSTKEEANFLLRVSRHFPFFKNGFSGVRFGRIVHLTSHAEFISKKKKDDSIPIYEGKFFNQFDGKYSGFNGVGDELRYGNKSSSVILDESKKKQGDYFPESRFFINRAKWLQLSNNHTEEFMLAWRSLTSATNTRTCIATVLPLTPASQSVQFLTTNRNDLLYLTGLFNSVTFDFILKKKLSGIDLTQSVINQMPIPNNEQMAMRIKFNGFEATIKEHISLLVFHLLENDVRLNSLFENLRLRSQEPYAESRFEVIRKIDLLFMALYKLNDSELELVLSEFCKQYSKNDLIWFKRELSQLLIDNSIKPTSSCVSASCVV